MSKPVKIAFLGCGFAARIHGKTLSRFPDPVNVYYASRDKSKADSYNQKFSGSGSFGSYQDAINADEIDAVAVLTPPAQHLEQVLQALAAGKHVIVEKPPFLTSQDFDTVRQESQKVGKQVLVAENYYYKPLLSRLRNLIHSGVIGEILFVHINALKKQEVSDWRGDTALSGGGALFEGGIHWINFISNLGLNLQNVQGFRPGSHEGMEKSLLVSLEYQEGAVGAFYYSWETPSLFKGLRLSKIYGKEGSITFESNGLFILVRGRKKTIVFPGLKDIAGYKGMFSDFIRAIRDNRPAQFELALARQDIKTIETIYHSIRR